ncbi:uncharacterized protein LOC110563610 isoform X4 [Meriones unguiculatus]|uniref:uncharacterized protein LOC110563610 isoform X4 n=1 Tax=Meriones unguiculatus TaxID=10047 RepID=UPI00293F4EE0|nr:uncharacterized protein LOC110563610 isoform X4 [Meriones unguiculatus]
MLITCFHVLLESFLAKYTVHFYVVSRALVKIRDRTDHEHIREDTFTASPRNAGTTGHLITSGQEGTLSPQATDQLQQDPAFLNSRGRQDQPPRLQFQRNEASLRQPNSTLLDWIGLPSPTRWLVRSLHTGASLPQVGGDTWRGALTNPGRELSSCPA